LSFPTAKLRALEGLLTACDDLVVAFSGGVDSSVLLHAAARALGPRTVAVIGDSPALPRRELAAAQAFAAELGVRCETLVTGELELDAYRANDERRCYFCRHTLFEVMERWAREHAFSTLAYGEITDDLLEPRAGRVAAAELAVRAPLREAGYSKADVRAYARAHGLEVADKPAAACLASRLAPGTPVTPERLARVEAAEEALRPFTLGLLRVRDHGRHARVEVEPAALVLAQALVQELRSALLELGFETLELAAYARKTLPSANTQSR
jgi:uncharacterized protein